MDERVGKLSPMCFFFPPLICVTRSKGKGGDAETRLLGREGNGRRLADIKGQRSNAYATRCRSTRARSGASSAVKSAMASRLRPASRKLRRSGTPEIVHPPFLSRIPGIAVFYPPTPLFLSFAYGSSSPFLFGLKVRPYFLLSHSGRGHTRRFDHGTALNLHRRYLWHIRGWGNFSGAFEGQSTAFVELRKGLSA